MEAEEGSRSQPAPGPDVSAPPSEAAPEGFPGPVATFLRALAAALQKFTMYPPGHPALERTAEEALIPLRNALRKRPALPIGVASRQLAFEGVESDPAHPRYSFLAGRLHRHQIAAVTFSDGIARSELESFLAAVAVEADRCERPLAAALAEEPSPWPHLRLQPIAYDKLAIANDPVEWSPPPDASASGDRAERLWLGLARLALFRDAVGDHSGQDATESLARALEELSTESNHAREVLARLIKISRELRTAQGAEALDLARRTSGLVALVEPDALRRILLEAGDASKRRRLLLDASRWMEPDSVVKLVRAIAGLEKQHISHWLLLLMSKLAQHASSGSPPVRAAAELKLQDQVAQLVTGWALEDIMPAGYGRALERMSHAAVGGGTHPVSPVDVEPERLLTMGLELDQTSPLVLSAVDALDEAGRFGELFEILERAPTPSETAAAIWRRVARPETMRRILASPGPDFGAIDRLVAQAGVRVAEPMLDILSSSASRGVRRKLFGRLAGLGSEIGPLVVHCLDDPRWFVRRNMLALMGELEDWPRKWSPATYATDSHPAVRREALKLMLRLPELWDMAVRSLLADTDSRSLALGLAAAQESPSAEALPLLMELAEDPDRPDVVRVPAVRALGSIGDREACAVLLRLVRKEGGPIARLFGRWELAEPKPAVLEALSALHRVGQGEPEARRVLDRAAKSDDEAVRAAASGRMSA